MMEPSRRMSRTAVLIFVIAVLLLATSPVHGGRRKLPPQQQQQQPSTSWMSFTHPTTDYSSGVFSTVLSHIHSTLESLQTFLAPPHSFEESWTTWFRREWPLMDWKVGVFVWNTAGRLLIVLTLVSILPGRLHGYAARLLRWPVLGIVNFLIFVELLVYVVIRLFIRIAEYLIARPKHRALRRRMMEAPDYTTWRSYARELDLSQKRYVWLEEESHKHCDSSSSQMDGSPYNWTLIQELRTTMRQARETGDSLLALATLQQCTRKNVGGIMSEDLFSYANTGEPKQVVHEFVEEVVSCARWLTEQVVNPTATRRSSQRQKQPSGNKTDVDQQQQQKQQYDAMLHKTVTDEKTKLWQSVLSATLSLLGTPTSDDDCCTDIEDDSFSEAPHQTPDRSLTVFHRQQVLEFMKRARASYGRTALCLSGGAMMGLYHLGHVRALIEAGVLPHIISGTSGGSVVGALVGTRTDEELRRDLHPHVLMQYLTCFNRPWGERMQSLWKTGAMFSFETWMEKIRWFAGGNMTFAEAYRKTGRVFCVTLSSTTKKSPPVLLNHVTTPNITVASAIVASAAVPGFVPPVRLQYKDANGIVRSQEGGETYYDGSIERDIPINGLAEMFNCQYIIACQCNPHIVPFFYNCKGGVGRPSRWSSGMQEDSWRGGFLLAALELYLKNDMKAKLRFVHDLGAGLGWSSSLLIQEFEGSTTIVPQVRMQDYFRLFSDPTVEEVFHYFQGGSVAAYEHLALIKLHYQLADVMDECIERLRDETTTTTRAIPRKRRSHVQLSLTTEPLSRKSSESTESLHEMTEDDDEDEYERQWLSSTTSY